MAFTFSIKDTYRQAVEAASGGKQTVLYDDKGTVYYEYYPEAVL